MKARNKKKNVNGHLHWIILHWFSGVVFLGILMFPLFIPLEAEAGAYCRRGRWFYDSRESNICSHFSEPTTYCFSRRRGYYNCGNASQAPAQRFCKVGNVYWPAEDCGSRSTNYCTSGNDQYRLCSTVAGEGQMRGNEDGSISVTGGQLQGVNISTGDRHSCLPQAVKRQLNAMVAMGWEVNLMSAHRSRADNARRGGASGSLHIQCRAADFTVSNVPRHNVAAYLLANRIGGLGLYCSGRFHIDNGRRRMWGGWQQEYMRSRSSPSYRPGNGNGGDSSR